MEWVPMYLVFLMFCYACKSTLGKENLTYIQIV